ncbi:four-carbon acid sugar kinase family protein [Sphaerimonospora sp. CA-214678]|uniref:four-carbon acid sugar kinase family protein n=1 Tax=Sphaerimonospora sp. CA-214678 TaxID=3240029 RepID=UPI003D93B286
MRCGTGRTSTTIRELGPASMRKTRSDEMTATRTDVRTVVLDDDPTGTQSATGVRVLFSWDSETLQEALAENPSVYILTNTRSIDEAAAVELVNEVRRNAAAAAEALGVEVRFVLRGDSTLRGHVFAESAQFMDPDSVLVFVPAFPAGGRRTLDNVHYVSIDGVDVPAHRTEFADDPVFSFHSSTLTDYVHEKSSFRPVRISLASVRSDGLLQALREAPGGSVVLPDVENDQDIAAIADAITNASAHGRRIVVRCGAPLAAELAGVSSTAPFRPASRPPRATLLVCGSHTAAASEQLRAVEERWGPSVVLETAEALADPISAGKRLAATARERLGTSPLVVISSERNRDEAHGTLRHGQRVMEALTTCVSELVEHFDLVVSKGGITSAEVARTGIGATSATVQGQIVPGVSVWRLRDRLARPLDYVVIPGNVGSERTIVEILDDFQVETPTRS